MTTLGSITPQAIEQGTTARAQIHGDGFVDIDSVVVSGFGVTVENAEVVDEHTVEFNVTVDSDALVGLRDVSVVLPDASTLVLAGSVAVTNFQSLVKQLRLMIGERISAGKTAADTFFSDDELTDMLVRHSNNLYLAASEAWGAKAADRANLVDMSESGSERKLSQLFRSAKAMQEGYSSAGLNIQESLVDRPVAKVASILGVTVGRPTPGSGFTRADYILDPVFNDPYMFDNALKRWPILLFESMT